MAADTHEYDRLLRGQRDNGDIDYFVEEIFAKVEPIERVLDLKQ